MSALGVLLLVGSTVGFGPTPTFRQIEPDPRDERGSPEGWDSPFQIRSKEPPAAAYNDFAWQFEYSRFHEWTFEFDDQGSAFGDDLDEDVERRKTGFQWRSGREQSGFVLGVFAETLETDGRIRDDVQIIGADIGVQGTPRVTPGRPISPLMDYSLLFSPHFGQGDDVFDDLFYFEADARFGIGLDVYGFQATGGIRSSLILGRFNLEDSAQAALMARGETIFGSNTGGYAALSYRGRDLPVLLRLQGVFGNLAAGSIAAGIRF